MNNFAVLTIAYSHTATSIIISIGTNTPCHLTCYYTDKEPRRHRTARNQRGLTLPWGVYYCFVAWQSVEQTEAGDTLVHTFEIPAWSYCQTKYFAFRGTVAGELSPSVSALFKHHHPGVFSYDFTIQVSTDNDDFRLYGNTLHNCPDACPGAIACGFYFALRLRSNSGARFQNVPIPKGATIKEAYLTFTSISTTTATALKSKLCAEQEDNPPDFTLDTPGSIGARLRNHSEVVPYDNPPAWILDQQYIGPDISVVIQEIIDRPGWASGNALVLFWQDLDERTGTHSTIARYAYPHNTAPAKAIKLFIKYEA